MAAWLLCAEAQPKEKRCYGVTALDEEQCWDWKAKAALLKVV